MLYHGHARLPEPEPIDEPIEEPDPGTETPATPAPIEEEEA